MSAANPEEALEQLPPGLQEALIAWAEVETVEAYSLLPPADLSIVGVGESFEVCWTEIGGVYGRNRSFVKMWSYWQKIEWCEYAGEITHGAMTDRWAEMHWPTWRFHDHIWEGQKLDKDRFFSVTQGKFSNGIGSVAVQYEYPCNQIRVWPGRRVNVLINCTL